MIAKEHVTAVIYSQPAKRPAGANIAPSVRMMLDFLIVVIPFVVCKTSLPHASYTAFPMLWSRFYHKPHEGATRKLYMYKICQVAGCSREAAADCPGERGHAGRQTERPAQAGEMP